MGDAQQRCAHGIGTLSSMGPRLVFVVLWAIAVAFLGLLASVATSQDEESLKVALDSSLARVAAAGDSAAASTNRFLLSIDVLLSALSSATGSNERTNALSLLAKSQLAVRDLVLLDTNGSVVASALPVTRRLGLKLPPALLHAVLETSAPKLVVSTPTESFATSETVIYFARRLTSASGEQLVAVALVPVGQVQANLGDPRDGFTLALQRADGTLIVAAPHSGLPESARVSRTPLRPLPAGQADHGKSDLEGKNSVMAVRALVHQGLLVTASVPEDLALAPWTEGRRNNGAAAAFLAVFAVIVASLAHFAISRLQRSNAELARAKQWLDQAIESVPEGVLLCDCDDRVVAWNSTFLAFYPWLRPLIRRGLPHVELVQHSVRNLFPSATPEQQAEIVVQRLALYTMPGGQFEHQMESGITVQVTETKTPAGGKVTVFRDITSADKELSAARRVAEAAHGSSERFVAGVRSELHDAAVSVLALIERASAAFPDAGLLTTLAGARNEAQQLVSDISDVYELFHLEEHSALDQEEFVLAPLLERAASHAHDVARNKQSSLTFTYSLTAATRLHGDARRLGQLAYATLRAVVLSTAPGSSLVASWHFDADHKAKDRIRLKLEVTAQRAETATAAIATLLGGNRMVDRPSTAIRLAKRLAELLDGELVVGDPQCRTTLRIAVLWVDLEVADRRAEALS